MGPTMHMKSRSSQVLGALMMALSALGLVTGVVDGPETLLRFGAPVALFGVLGWGAFWEPHVEVSDGGVTVANTLRTVEVPWPAIEGVDGRYGLRLDTAYGPVDAWAAAAPSGRRRARGQQSEAAEVVTRRIEELRAAGHLEQPRLERPAPHVTWHVPLVSACLGLVIAALVLPLVA